MQFLDKREKVFNEGLYKKVDPKKLDNLLIKVKII